MEIIKFKTNVSDEKALAKVTPYLDKEQSISKWNIDIESDGGVLSASGNKLDPQVVENALQQAGFKAEIIRVLGIGGADL